MLRHVPLLAASLALAGCAREPLPTHPNAEEAWIRLAAVPGRPGAAYFTLRGGPSPARLVEISGAQVERVELHDGGGAGGAMRMAPVSHVVLAPDAVIRFQPGGRHAMLYGIDPGLAPLSRTRLRFRFSDGTRVEREAFAVAAGDPAPTFAPSPDSGETSCRPAIARDGERITIATCAR